MRGAKFSLSVLLFAVIFTSSLSSQDIANTAFSPIEMMQINNVQFNPVVNSIIENGRNSNSTKGSKNGQNAEIDISAATYTPSKARTKANLAAFADKTRAADPAQADKMEALFASADIIGEIASVMANFGLSRNNAGDAFALYWVAAWQAAHSDTSTPSKAMVKAVASQAARGLSQSPEFAAANDAQKQEMAEALMVQAALIEASVEDAGGDAVKLKALGKAVKQGASASGLELDTMTLTEEGFREGSPRKRSDASDTGEDEKALAANDTGTDSGGETNYALIAAAAGAGLGGVFLFGKAMGRRG